MRRFGVEDLPSFPGEPAPYEVGNAIIAGNDLGVNRIRFKCDGGCTIYTEGTHGDHGSVGVGIVVPAGRVVELELGNGNLRELVPGFVVDGVLLEPAIGTSVYVIGGQR